MKQSKIIDTFETYQAPCCSAVEEGRREGPRPPQWVGAGPACSPSRALGCLSCPLATSPISIPSACALHSCVHCSLTRIYNRRIPLSQEPLILVDKNFCLEYYVVFSFTTFTYGLLIPCCRAYHINLRLILLFHKLTLRQMQRTFILNIYTFYTYDFFYWHKILISMFCIFS